MKDSVAIFGGFAGSESINQSAIDNRNFTTNETILSGDLLDDDNSNVSTIDASRDDNSYHIFYRSNTDSLSSLTILDGLTISDGNGGTTNKGGAIYTTGKIIKPTFRNLIIQNCSAEDGGGIYVNAVSNGRIAPKFTNVKFINNRAEDTGISSVASGGAMYIGGNNTNLIVDITFENVDFENNSCEGYYAMGGAIYAFIHYSGAITFLDFDTCSFTGNTVAGTDRNGKGGAIWAEVMEGAEGYFEFKNTLFCSNDATGLTSYKGFGGVGHFTEGLNGTGVLQANFTNTTIVNNSANGSGESFYISGSNADLSFVNTIIYSDDIYTTDAGNYVSSNSLINTGDPKFVDESNCDYRLKVGSDALGIGDGVNGNNAGLYQGTGEDLPDFTYNSSEIDFGTVVIGYSSTEQSMSISATNVHDKLFLIAPDDVELTLTSDDYTGKTDTIELTPTLEEIATTTIYYRYAPTSEGTFIDSIKIEADGFSEMKPLKGKAIKSKAIYVKYDAAGADDGTSWTDAYTELYIALDSSLNGDTIFVAKGTYKPETSSKFNEFMIDKDVKVYGGFAGNETNIDNTILINRDFEANETILSGDIDDNGSLSGNTYQVVYISGGDENILDGFTITGGYNYISNANYTALYCYGGDVILRNLIFHDNKGYKSGGALFLTDGTFDIDSVQFYSNIVSGSTSQCYGGAIYIDNSTVLINKAYFWDNEVENYYNAVGCDIDGGAIFANASDVTIINTTFYDNREDGIYGTYTGNVHNENGTLTTINTIFDDGGLYNYGTGTTNLSYSYYHGTLPSGTTDAGNNVLSTSSSYIDPRFVDSDNGDFGLYGDSQCLNTGDQINGENIGYYQDIGLAFPSITITGSSLDFSSIPTGTISDEQSYTISGTNLNSDINIYAPSGFEISSKSGNYEGITDNIVLSHSGGEVSETNIYVRFAPSSSGTYNNTISNISNGAETKYISVSGKGGLLPTISFSGSIYDFGNQEIELPSNSDSYYVYGYNYYDDLYIAAPDGFEISFDYDFVGNTDTLVISPDASGDKPYTQIRVRFNPTEVKEYTDSILHFTKYKEDTTVMHVSGTGIEAPSLNFAPASLDFGNVYMSEYTNELGFRMTGSNLGNYIELYNNYDIEMTMEPGNYSGDIGYIFLNSTGSIDTTVYVRFRSYTLGSFNSNITINSDGIYETYQITGNVIEEGSPFISTDKSYIDFGNINIGETSEQSFSFSGDNLDDNVTINGTSNFEITLTSGDYSGNTSQIVMTPEDGTIDSQVVYVRFKPTINDYYSDYITLISSGASTASLNVVGYGVAGTTDPTIYLSEESLSFGEILVNQTSNTLSFDISGLNLVNDLILNVSSPFEISLDAEDFSSDVTQIVIPTPEEGNIGAMVYVRFSPNEEGNFGGSVLAHSGTIEQTLSLYGIGITETTGIENLSSISVNVYPNPTANNLFIKTENNEKINKVKIYNTIGALVKHAEIFELNNPVDVSDLTKGVYFLQIELDDGYKTIQIIKQ